MKSNLLIIVIVLSVFLHVSCRDNEPEQVSVIELKFDTNVGYISIIETIQNDPSIYKDTIINKFLPSEINGYSFKLFLSQEIGSDFIIFSPPCNKTLIISKIIVNNDHSFSYLFDGINKNDKDNPIFINANMLCK